ncbi:MAG: hypothetical protein Q7U20_07065, partial [Caulobacter sp.]|nr:hypothetical protein [Caulobacter sp.]
GFGKAALAVAAEMRMAPAIRNGLPVEAEVRVPLLFKLPRPEPLPTLDRSALFVLAGGCLTVALLLLAGLLAMYRLFGRGRDG